MAGDPAALQVDHEDVPEEGHHVPLLALRVKVEAEPGEAGDDGVQLGFDEGQQDQECQLAAPEQNQWTQILNRMIIIISILVCSTLQSTDTDMLHVVQYNTAQNYYNYPIKKFDII